MMRSALVSTRRGMSALEKLWQVNLGLLLLITLVSTL